MSFWPFCCKKPQAYPISPDAQGLADQYCVHYGLEPAGRPRGMESLSLAGARSGRVVTNPLKFKSLCGNAGVTEDGKLYAWGGAFQFASQHRNSHTPNVETEDEAGSPPLLGATGNIFGDEPEGFAGLHRVGGDSDWESVSSRDGRIIAIKADQTLWTFGSWQSGVDCQWGSQPSAIKPEAFRAKLSAPIASMDSEPDGNFLQDYGFVLPVWFTAKPPAASVQKVRLRRRLTGAGTAEITTSEPGGGAAVSSEFRAKIDTGAIRNITITSGGSGLEPGRVISLTISDGDGSGAGAKADAVVGDSGSVELVIILNPGEGYRNPVTATTSVAGISLAVDPPRRLRVTSGGSGYTSVPTVVLTPANGETGPAAGASVAVTKMSLCGVGSFEPVAAGSGYTFATATEARTGATATAVVGEGGVITGWTLNSPGNAVYSPLDEEPLSVTITGDGEGATARAVPAGSSVEEIDVVSNPEVWTLPPLISFEGGGGQGAAAVAEGVIGRVSVAVTAGGSGYTKTSRTNTGRTLFSPCALASAGGDTVGGRRAGGSVIVAEAVLSPSGVTTIDEDPAGFCNPYNSPCRPPDYTPPDGSPADYTPPEQSLAGHRLVVKGLTQSSTGVVDPFEIEIPGWHNTFGSFSTDQEWQELVQHSLRFYLRGAGHSRVPLNCEYIPGSPTNPMVRVSLQSPVAMPQPPALCYEILARPHRDAPVGRVDGTYPNANPFCSSVSLDFEPKPNPKSWWAGRNAAYFQEGTATVTSSLGASNRYQVVDGSQIIERLIPALAPAGSPQPTATVAGLVEYLGPLAEGKVADPAEHWRQPSSPQRIHFLFPSQQSFSARGFAEAVYDSGLGQTKIGAISVVEAGDGYTEEPEPMLLTGSDPVPVNSGLTGCTSAGFGPVGEPYYYYANRPGDYYSPFAVCSGEAYWWGYDTAITDGVRLGTQTGTLLTAKPTKIGGHLRFSVSGTIAGGPDWEYINSPLRSAGGPVYFLRLPRPSHGNRVAHLASVFLTWPPAVDPSLGLLQRGVDFDPSIPGVQSGESLFRYLPWPLRPSDHGFGYEGEATVAYIGPGLAPHTLSLTATVVGNGIVRVGRNGLLKDSQGRWLIGTADWGNHADTTLFGHESAILQPRTISKETAPPGDNPCDVGRVIKTVIDGSPVTLSPHAIVIRSAGSGYLAESGAEVQVTYQSASMGAAVGGNPQVFSVVDENRSLLRSLNVSSYGGIIRIGSSVSIQAKAGSQPPTVAVTGGGQGAVIEAVPVSSPMTPFVVFCNDPLSEQVDPASVDGTASGLAVDSQGFLRCVVGGWLYSPEAFRDLPQVTGIVGPLEQDFLTPYPHEDEGYANFLVRDVSETVWGVRIATGPVPYGASEYQGRFLKPTVFGEAQAPIVMSPLSLALTSTGGGYDYPVRVEVTQPADVAKATATINGKVVGIAVVDSGSGYESPPIVTATGGGGTAAAEVDISGPVWDVKVTAGGTGYRLPPKVRFSSPGVPAVAKATIDNGQVKSVQVTSGGLYTQAPQVFFDPDFDVESISLTAGGQNYTTAPSVVIEGGASATAEISAAVIEIPLTSSGSRYTTTPEVEITGGGGTGAIAQAVLEPATGTIVRIEVISGGTGYTTPPSIRVVGGGGSGATGFAKIAGPVSQITLVSRGGGYDRPPAVIISGGGGTGATATATIAAVGSGAAATARINGSVVAVRVTQTTEAFQKPPVVSCQRASTPQAAGDPPRIDATLKAVITGRPQSVTVTKPGNGYSEPWFSDDDEPDSRQTPSRRVRRSAVWAKGSFCSGEPWRSQDFANSAPIPIAKPGPQPQFSLSYRTHAWNNASAWLGAASAPGAPGAKGAPVTSVHLPQAVIGFTVTNPGSGYAPFSVVGIKAITPGVFDDRFRVLRPELPLYEYFGYAYTDAEGKVTRAVPAIASTAHFLLFFALQRVIPYTSPPQFEVDSPGGGGVRATVTPVMGHPLECYYAPEVLFDGAIEAEADMSLTIAGACIEGGGLLRAAYFGGGSSFPYLAGRIDRPINRVSLLQAANPFLSNGDSVLDGEPDLRLGLAGKVAGFARSIALFDWTTEDNATFGKSLGFYSTAPSLVIEDEQGSGAALTMPSLPSSGKLLPERLHFATVQNGGSGYTFRSRFRLKGGRPLAWDNPATAVATVVDGEVTAISIQGQGLGYTKPPKVYIAGDGTGAEAVVDASSIDEETGRISAIRIVAAGSGYTSATVTMVDAETVAEQSPAVAELCDLLDRNYSVVLEQCRVERATMPGELRRQRTTVSVRQTIDAVELGPADSHPASYIRHPTQSIWHDLEAAGVRLHSAYLSDGHVEYIRLENHFGELPASPPVVTITPTSDVQPAVAATAIATTPTCDNVFSSAAANVTHGGADFPPYQLEGTVLSGQPLVFDLSNDSTYSGNITGTGNVIKRGPGTLTLTGQNTFVGSLVIEAGRVTVKSPPPGADIVLSGGDVVFDMESSGEFSGTISGTGSLIKRGRGVLTLAESPTITGGITIDNGGVSGAAITVSGEMRIADGVSLSSNITLAGGTVVFDIANKASYSGEITGSGTVVKQGSGGLALGGLADFVGEFRLEAGTLEGSVVVGEDTTIRATGGSISASVTLNGGRVVFAQSGLASHTGSISGAGVALVPSGVSLTFSEQSIAIGGGVVLTVAGEIIVQDGAQLTIDVELSGGELLFDIEESGSYSGIITGNGSVTKQGEGVLDFSGEADFSGDFDVSDGLLGGSVYVGSLTSLAVYSEMSANVTLDGGRLDFIASGYVEYEGAVSGAGAVSKFGAGLLALLGQFAFDGEVWITTGALAVLDGAAITADIRLNSGAVVFDLDGGYAYEGEITGDGSVFKQGEGALTLSSRNTFLGLVSILGGSLQVLEGVNVPLPFVSATFTPTTLTVAFSGTPAFGSAYVIFNAETGQSYPSVAITGTSAIGYYASPMSRLVITS